MQNEQQCEITEANLWEIIVSMQGQRFTTSGRGNKSGVEFTYSIKYDKNGEPSGEMFVSTKEKSITKATVLAAYRRASEVQALEGKVSGPKKIGTFGASYLYPIFLKLGIITKEQKIN